MMLRRFLNVVSLAKTKIKAALIRTGNHPLYAVLVTIFGVLAGLSGSLYSSQIKETLKLLRPLWQFVPETAVFWLALFIFAGLFFGRQWASDEKTGKAQQNLIEKSSALEKLVKTLPPQGFLTRFSETYALSHEATYRIFNQDITRPDEVDLVIRFILQNVVSLASAFDGQPDGVRYAANVMVYYSRVGIAAEEEAALRGKILFFDRDPLGLAGYLKMEPTLSTSTDSASNQDSSLDDFTLPVERVEVSPQGRYRQLPGAPLAFQQNGALHYDDTTSLGEWCRRYGDFSESIAKQVETYFLSEKAQRIKSFVSLAIPDSAEKQRPIGVLNVHRNRPNMLRGEEAFPLFFPLLKPYAMLIGNLLRVRHNLLKKH